jgi:hypothetical protein
MGSNGFRLSTKRLQIKKSARATHMRRLVMNVFHKRAILRRIHNARLFVKYPARRLRSSNYTLAIREVSLLKLSAVAKASSSIRPSHFAVLVGQGGRTGAGDSAILILASGLACSMGAFLAP